MNMEPTQHYSGSHCGGRSEQYRAGLDQVNVAESTGHRKCAGWVSQWDVLVKIPYSNLTRIKGKLSEISWVAKTVTNNGGVLTHVKEHLRRTQMKLVGCQRTIV